MCTGGEFWAMVFILTIVYHAIMHEEAIAKFEHWVFRFIRAIYRTYLK